MRNEPTLTTGADLDRTLDPARGDATIPRSNRRRSRVPLYVAFMVAAMALVMIVLLQRPPARPAPALADNASTVDPRAGAPRYPIESTPASLPPLDASDELMLAALQSAWTGGGILPFIQPKDLVRNIVVTVDNLPRRTLPVAHSPLKAAPGAFATTMRNGALVANSNNAARYAPYIALLDSVDAQKLVALYVRNYPLFQQAYRDLGYPQGHFNDRLVEAIDVMLATPVIGEPLSLAQPKVFYEFADRDIEKLPAGQKLLLRAGPENAARVKERLREARALITAQSLSAPDAAR
ncbi:MAG TPA: DUF3014 domain-containing protein [Casimicrobiaceae bacterium]|nr:DUF3014 domain-containing protein [Casimicrobiaceae bacterium]